MEKLDRRFVPTLMTVATTLLLGCASAVSPSDGAVDVVTDSSSTNPLVGSWLRVDQVHRVRTVMTFGADGSYTSEIMGIRTGGTCTGSVIITGPWTATATEVSWGPTRCSGMSSCSDGTLGVVCGSTMSPVATCPHTVSSDGNTLTISCNGVSDTYTRQ